MQKPPLKMTLWALLSLVIIYTICFIWLDRPIAYWALHTFTGSALNHWCDGVRKALAPTHWLVAGIVAAMIALVLHRKKSPHTKNVWLFALSCIAAFIVCGILKTILARYRPIELFQHGFYGFHWFSFKNDFCSTPSGHAAGAFAGLFALAMIFKKRLLTVLLLLIAMLVCITRIVQTNHFLGDVIFGAYVGILTVYWVKWFIDRNNAA